MSYTYDGAGRLSTVTDANGGVTTYAYDANSNMVTVTDPKGILYLTNQYDSNGRVTQQTMADGTTYQFAWTLSSYMSEVIMWCTARVTAARPRPRHFWIPSVHWMRGGL